MKKLLSILMLLVAIVTGAKAEDITLAPGLSQNIAKLTYGLYTISHSSTASSSGSKISNGAITTGTNGDVITINFKTTKSDMYIKSVTFNSLSNGTLSSEDGPIAEKVFTTSGNKNEVNVVLTSQSGKKGSVKITNVVVNTGTNNVETITFSSVTSGDIAFTSKINGTAVTSAISSITSNGNATVSSNVLSWPNSKTLAFTSENDIKYIALYATDDKFYNSGGLSATPDTYADAAWNGSSKTVTFTNGTGGGRTVKNAFVITQAAGPVDPTFTLSSEEVEVGSNISVNGPEGLEFTATPVGETTGEVSVSGGTITGVTAGAAKVQVTSSATDKYNAYDHTFDITVIAAKIATELSFGTPTTTVARGEQVTNAATLTAGGETISGTINYSSADETIATVDATGKVTGVKAGTTSIKANYEGDATYSAAEEVSYNITVTLPALTPVSNKTWTVADAALLEAYPVDSKTTSKSITATNVVDNMEIVATSEKPMTMAYNKNAATHDDLPSGLTYRFQTLGNPGENNNTRYLHFKAVANSKVSAYFIRGTEGVNVAGYSLGTLDSANPTGTYTNPGGSVDKMVFTTGDTETDVYLYSVSEGSSKGVQFIAVKVEPIQSQNVTVGETGFATIGMPFATTVPAGVTAYAVESVAGSKVKMSAAIPASTPIPANKGFVIVAAKGTYSFTEVATAEYEDPDLLEAVGATPKAATTEAPIYVLTITGEKKVGFKKATSGELGAYKAYLPGTVSNSSSLSVSFDEETAINGIAESEANAEAPVKVIKNGKLFIGNYNVAGQLVK